MEKTRALGSCLTVAAAILAVASCGGDGGGGSGSTTSTLSGAVCDPSAGPFSLATTNPFFPLPVGHQLRLAGSEDGEDVELVITVLDEVEVVAGVSTRVVEERETAGGELVEVSRNFFAEAPDGTLCYFGEDVEIFDAGEVVSNEGQWRAGVDGASPGIIMPGDPQVGDSYDQEHAPGIAEDHAEVTARGEPTTVPAGTFTDTVTTFENSPLDDSTSTKVYASGIGLVKDDGLELTGAD